MTRGRAVLALLVASGLMWVVSTRTWAQNTVSSAQTVPGVAGSAEQQSNNSPLLLACAAVVAVCALLLAMLSGFGRWIVCGLSALAGLGYAGMAVSLLAGPERTTAWPAVGIAIGVLAAAASIWVAMSVGGWHASSRFERAGTHAGAPSPDTDPASAWDALSRGEDPSEDADPDDDTKS